MIRTLVRGFGLILIAGVAGSIAALLVCHEAGVFDLEDLSAREEDLPTAIELLEESSE